MAEPIRFAQTSVGVEIVGAFPAFVDMSREFLAQVDPKMVKREGNFITITAANAEGIYEIISWEYPDWDGQPTIARCRKVGMTRMPGGPPLPKHPLPPERQY